MLECTYRNGYARHLTSIATARSSA
jgi:hypothetical protein